MADYDYQQLSPNDFETFVRDLLQEAWKISIESFKSGRDGGIDLRHSDASGTTIFQCKHYVRTGLPGLLRDLQKEAIKVRKLKPSRYIVATSVPLSPGNKDDIVEIIGSDVLSSADVLGKDDLNNLLGQHEKVEGRHFKLWLASRAVLDRVLHNAFVTQTDFQVQKVYADIRRYVQSEAYPDALKVLSRERVVIIAGPPGVGKTTLANMLLYAHLERGYKAVVIQRDVHEGATLFQEGEKKIFYYDDFLGTTSLGDHAGVLTRNGDRAILGFIGLIRASKTARLVLTTREHILQQAYTQSEQMAHSSIEDYKLVLHMSSYTFGQRALILYNHLYFSDLPPAYQDEILRGDFYLKIIKHKKFNPRLIEWLATFRRVKDVPANKYREFIESLLDDPSEIWRHAYHNEISDAARSLLLTLFTFNGRVGVGLLQAGYSVLHAFRAKRYNFQTRPEDFRTALRELVGAFINFSSDQIVEVLDPSVLDLLNAVLLDNPQNLADLLAGTSSWIQVQRVWMFISIPPKKYLLSTLIADKENIAESLRRILLENRKVDLGDGSVGYRGPTVERRLATLVDIADQLQSRPCLAMITELANHLKAYWSSDHVDIADGAEIIAAFDSAEWSELQREAADVKEMCKAAVVNAAGDGCSLDDLKALVEVLEVGSDGLSEEVAQALRTSLHLFERQQLDDRIIECRSVDDFDGLIGALEEVQSSLSIDLSDSIQTVRDRLEEFEQQQSAYEDQLQDEWRERWADERQTDNSVRDLFSSLKGDRG